MRNPPDPQPGEIWRYGEHQAVRVIEEVASPESTKRYMCELLTGPNRGSVGLVYRDEMKEKTDEL